jgi:Zn-dependent protease with chaperone function
VFCSLVLYNCLMENESSPVRKKTTPGSILFKVILFLGGAFFFGMGCNLLIKWGLAQGGSEAISARIDSLSPLLRWSLVALSFLAFAAFLLSTLYTIRRIPYHLMEATGATLLPQEYKALVGNITEGLSIASGIPAPWVLMIPEPQCLNAFTVPGEGSSRLFLTKDLFTYLSKEELTAVVAHEYAHINNGDLDRFTLNTPMLRRLLSVRWRKRRFFSILVLLFPLLLWLSILVGMLVNIFFSRSVVMQGWFSGLLCLFASASLFTMVLAPRPKYQSESGKRLMLNALAFTNTRSRQATIKDEWQLEFQADKDAVLWTYYPEALRSALRKIYHRSFSRNLSYLNGVAFAPTQLHDPKPKQDIVSGIFHNSFKRSSWYVLPPPSIEERLRRLAELQHQG